MVLSAALVGAGYYDAWLNRHPPLPAWEHVPTQAAWLAVTTYLGAAGLLAWRRDRRPQALIPDAYGLSVAGCAVFLAGILINGWWSEALGPDFGVPAIFRVPNLLEIAGATLIVIGPLRASVGRGELLAGPTAVVSAALLLATVTFFTQFDHPYIDQYASVGGVQLPDRSSPFDPFNYREEILGAMGLLIQTAAVTGVVLWILRQTRLPVGSVTLMLTLSGFLIALQRANYSMILVAAIVGALADVALVLARPRADRVLRLRLFAVAVGALLSGVYVVAIAIGRTGRGWIFGLELRKTIAAAIEHLRESNFQQDAQGGAILDLYYVRRIGGHYAVTMRVGLSRAAYFNRRSYGVGRLADRLRELEESAAPA